MMIMKVINAMN